MTGAEIKVYRQQAGLTQKKLGVLIGMSRNSIDDWEHERRAIPAKHVEAIKQVMSRETKAPPAAPKTSVQDAKTCRACPYWRHMDGAKSATMYCAHLQEVGRERKCGVERTYQRYRALSPLSLDAARAAELGVSYGQYKAMGR